MTGPVTNDGIDCGVTITDADGTGASYVAVEFDLNATPQAPLIAFATFAPFLSSLPCLFAKDSRLEHPVIPDARCLNGIFLVPAVVTRALRVPAPGLRRIELERCDGAMPAGSLKLFIDAGDAVDAGSPTTLAVGVPPAAPTADGTCQIIDYDFPAAGTYEMEVLADPGLSPIGDYAFRFF